MSFYNSLNWDDAVMPDGAIYFDVAWHGLGLDVRVTLDGKTCYPTPDEARAIAAMLIEAAHETEASNPAPTTGSPA